MGMFDDLKCEYPLPAYPQMQEHTFQTKDLICELETFTITKEGTLIGPYVSETYKNSYAKFRGEIRFYDFLWQPKSSQDDPFPPLIEFSALFNDGKLIDIRHITKEEETTTDATGN